MIVDLNLKGKLVIVIGGGQQAQKKISSLLDQECQIMVFSDKISMEIKNLVKEKKIQFKPVKLEKMDFLSKYKPFLVMTTTDDHKLNKKIVKKAKQMQCLVYSSDDPKDSDFSHLSIINIKGEIIVAISTKGKSPIMAKKIRQEAEKTLNEIIKKEDINQIKLQEIAREEAKKKIPTQRERKKVLYNIMNDSMIKQLIKDNKFKKAQKRAMVLLRDWQ